MADATLPLADAERAEALHRFAPGTSIGRFRITNELGSGGMGTVFEAYDPDLDRAVAIKVLADSHSRKLMDEAQAMARLSHPNVVPIHEVGEVDGQLFLVMELVRGETLDRWLEQPHSWREIVGAFVAAGAGLAAAHRAGLVHRDFKPNNVLVDRSGHVRVSDFGLARADGFALGSDARAAGTPGFMAPEQADGRPIDARTDEYAFGVSLERAFAGKRAPRRVRAAIARATATDPGARYPSMDALLATLRGALAARRRRTALVVATTVLAGTLGAYVAYPARLARDCDSDSVHAVWNPATAAATGRRLAAVRPDAAIEIATMRRIVDGWTARWELGRREACRAEPAARAARVSCLDDALGELRAQLATWSAPDAVAVDRVAISAGALPEPSRCAHPAPPVSERARPILDRVAAVTAAHRAGRARSVATLAPGVVADARVLGEPSVLSAALVAAGTIASDLDDLETARAEMAEAVIAAGKADDDARLLEALRDEAAVTIALGRPVDGLGLLDAADAVTARSGAGEDGRTATIRGNALLDAGKLADAAHALEHAVAILEPAALHDPARDLELASALNLLGDTYYEASEVDKARPLELRALAIRERELGPQHPDVGDTLADLAQLEGKADKLDDADAYIERARKVYVAAYGPDDQRVGEALSTRGYLAARRGDRAQGIALTEQARTILQRTLAADDLAFVSIEQQLGAMSGCAAGIAHFERAAAILEQRHNVAETHGVIVAQLAVCLVEAGRLDDAYAAATKAVAELERSGAAPAQLAMSWMTLADLEAKRGHRTRAIELAQHLLATTKDGESDALSSMRAHETAQLTTWQR
jgi:tetratricopeptide (TPR) repeat protein/predicted Ser/Thr protein kinase